SPCPTLFPYTTLFRSVLAGHRLSCIRRLGRHVSALLPDHPRDRRWPCRLSQRAGGDRGDAAFHLVRGLSLVGPRHSRLRTGPRRPADRAQSEVRLSTLKSPSRYVG